MEHARRRCNDEQEGDSDPWVEGRGNLHEQSRLTEGTQETQRHTQEVELHGLAATENRQEVDRRNSESMNTSIRPGSDGVYRSVFPSLEAMAMGEVVSGLPIVEDLVAVVDRMVERSNHVACKEDGKCNGWRKWRWFFSRTVRS